MSSYDVILRRVYRFCKPAFDGLLRLLCEQNSFFGKVRSNNHPLQRAGIDFASSLLRKWFQRQ
jgi:hypothetical protein